MTEYKGVEYEELAISGTSTKNVAVKAGEGFERGQILTGTSEVTTAKVGDEATYIAYEDVEASTETQVTTVYDAGEFKVNGLKGYDESFESDLRKNNIKVRGEG